MNKPAKIPKASMIFIIGSGRSGTTILYNLLAMHPDICYFSTLTSAFPRFPQLAVFHRILDIPMIGRVIRKKIMSSNIKTSLLLPSEGENIYSKYCGFINTHKTTAINMDKAVYQKFSGSIAWHLRATGRNIFVTKQTSNTQRLELLHVMFPNAYWIHIIRDGRAVANSLLHVVWWKTVALWWINKQPKQKQDIALCGKHWKTNVDEILKHISLFGHHYVEIRYESLVNNPRAVLVEILRQIHIPENPDYISALPKALPNKNNKWKMQLTTKQKNQLTKTIKPLLTQLRYI